MTKTYLDKSIKPSNENLEKNLTLTFQFYTNLNNLTKNFKKEWNFSKSSGWMQKVYDNKKALYYLIPLQDSFKISLTIREVEKKNFIKNVELKEIYKQIIDAKKYSEGFAIQFVITNLTTFTIVRKFIELLIEGRK